MAVKLNDALIEIQAFQTAFIANLSCFDEWFIVNEASCDRDKSILILSSIYLYSVYLRE